MNTRPILRWFDIVSICMVLQLLAVLGANAMDCGTFGISERLSRAEWTQIKAANQNAQLPKPEFQVGDTHMFWVWNLAVMPPQTIQISTTCRAKGLYSYIWVADDQWGTVDQDKVDAVLSAWEDSSPATSYNPEEGIYQINTSIFGPAPDELDNDDHINILYYDIGSYQGSSFDGYFKEFDQMTDQQAQIYGERSNECEILYLDCNPSDPMDPYMLGVLSHEFQHMIHWKLDYEEVLWVNEGCSQLAWFLCGYGTDGSETAFANAPNDDLTVWDSTLGDYGQVLLFFVYLYEQYGVDAVSAIASNENHGFVGIGDALENLGWYFDSKQTFTWWCLANFIDDPSLDHGQYGYQEINPPHFKIAKTLSTYPTGETYANRVSWAAYYARFTSGTQQLNVNLGASETDIRGFLLFSNSSSEKYVMPMDPGFHGMQVPGFGTADAVVDLIVVNRESPANPQSFEFCATDASTADASPPYVVQSAPYGNNVNELQFEINLMDGLSALDMSTIQVRLNQIAITPQIETITDKNIMIRSSLAAIEPMTPVEITLDAADNQGKAMTTFTQNFRTADRSSVTLGVTLAMPSHMFHATEACSLDAIIGNPGEPMEQVPLFVILGAYGSYYFAPTWESSPAGLGGYLVDLAPGETHMNIIPLFNWPSGIAPASGLVFYGAITDANVTQILGEFDAWEFGWE